MNRQKREALAKKKLSPRLKRYRDRRISHVRVYSVADLRRDYVIAWNALFASVIAVRLFTDRREYVFATTSHDRGASRQSRIYAAMRSAF